jgi:hypothetical protein
MVSKKARQQVLQFGKLGKNMDYAYLGPMS